MKWYKFHLYHLQQYKWYAILKRSWNQELKNYWEAGGFSVPVPFSSSPSCILGAGHCTEGFGGTFIESLDIPLRPVLLSPFYC